ncbi:MAG: asparaginase [Oscillospiraceae bacterium]|nr:asparaginase [Oscillospiraceae bacterium]
MQNKKKVLIIYTGGTIGMVETEDGYATKSGYLHRVLGSMSELFHSGMPQWELIEFEHICDSSNISIVDWSAMAHTIRDNYDIYDGFVILHGTDTMAYTASALSFMLEGLGKTVVLTGAQIPIGHARSDARDNLIGSIIIAGEGKVPEVCLYFGKTLLRGNRATKVSADEMEAFASPNFPPLATAGIEIRYIDALVRPRGEKLNVVDFAEELPIAVLKIFPGIQFKMFENIMTENLKALVIEAFCVGNIPQYDAELLPLISKAADNGTIIVVCTQCLRGKVQLGAYETSSALKRAGAVSGGDMTVEAAVTKLRYLFAKRCSSERIKKYMETDLRGELSE